MREITAPGSRIFVWRGASAEVGENVRALSGPPSAFLLTDRNCRKIADTVQLSLEHAGIRVVRCALPPGEKQKSLSTAGRLYDAMLRGTIDRGSALVTVGGGVVGDLGGFVASTYHRGIALFHVPTTLLAQVDASIGGKTGVNLRQGKNLVGTFYAPRAVFVDPMTLASLPRRHFVAGLAEVAKCAMIRDAELFGFLEANVAGILAHESGPVEEILFRSASVKAAVVTEDEKESGVRAILNYGHTVGHAIEAAGRYSKVHHGEAVSIGMEAEARIARDLGIFSTEGVERQARLLDSLGLPRRAKGFSGKKVRAAMSVDKKNREGHLRFALPEGIGTARIDVEVPEELVGAALEAVLGPP